jgi:hypothetical protein
MKLDNYLYFFILNMIQNNVKKRLFTFLISLWIQVMFI